MLSASMGNLQHKNEQQENNPSTQETDIQDYLKRASARFVIKYHQSPSKEPIEERTSLKNYTLHQCLGKGAFANVYLALKKSGDIHFYAIKVLNKRKIIIGSQQDHVLAERRLLNAVHFPFLIKFHDSFQDNSNLYLSLEFVPGGELFGLLRQRMFFMEDTSRFYAGQVVLALEYLHHLNIAYRDLKPENILMAADGYLKIADFGFAKLVPNRTYTLCGTPEYLAPEIIESKGYSRSVDWWAFGVLVFELSAGFSPFFSEHSRRIYEKILMNKYKFPHHFSKEMRSLIRRLLEPDLSKRIGTLRNRVNDVKDHQWFLCRVDWRALFEKKVPLPLELKRHSFDRKISLGPVTVIDIDAIDASFGCFEDF